MNREQMITAICAKCKVSRFEASLLIHVASLSYLAKLFDSDQPPPPKKQLVDIIMNHAMEVIEVLLLDKTEKCATPAEALKSLLTITEAVPVVADIYAKSLDDFAASHKARTPEAQAKARAAAETVMSRILKGGDRG